MLIFHLMYLDIEAHLSAGIYDVILLLIDLGQTFACHETLKVGRDTFPFVLLFFIIL